MKILFFLAIAGGIGVAVFIYLEKNKKSSNVLIEKSEIRKEQKENKTENNLQTNNPLQTK